MTDAEIKKVVAAVTAGNATRDQKLLEKVPGGAAGALLACVLLSYFAKTWIDDVKAESLKQGEALIRIEQNQKLLQQDVLGVKEDVAEVKVTSGDRWTRNQALTKDTQQDQKLAQLENKLDIRGDDWMPMVERRIQKLEMLNKIEHSE